jgi:hypothetical protein
MKTDRSKRSLVRPDGYSVVTIRERYRGISEILFGFDYAASAAGFRLTVSSRMLLGLGGDRIPQLAQSFDAHHHVVARL